MRPTLNMTTLEPNFKRNYTEDMKLFKKVERALMYGATLEEVANEHGITKNTVVNLLVRNDTSATRIRGNRPNWRKIRAEKGKSTQTKRGIRYE